MDKSKRNLTGNHSHIRLSPKLFKPNEFGLARERIKELDREFARQTKQLTALTKRLGRKVSKNFLSPFDK